MGASHSRGVVDWPMCTPPRGARRESRKGLPSTQGLNKFHVIVVRKGRELIAVWALFENTPVPRPILTGEVAIIRKTVIFDKY